MPDSKIEQLAGVAFDAYVRHYLGDTNRNIPPFDKPAWIHVIRQLKIELEK